MLGYKFTNIKIQTVLIKQIIYHFLYNSFVVSPNMFIKAFLNGIDKNNFDNSKEKYLEFLKENKFIKDEFFNFLNSKDTKIKNYIYLTCILNNNNSVNFDNFSESEIQEQGKVELENLFFEVFLEFISKAKEIFEIKDSQESAISGASTYSKANFVQTLIDSSFYIETLDSFDKPMFISHNWPSLTDDAAFDLCSKIDYPTSTLVNFKDKIDSNIGIFGEYYYKIKERIPVELSCGNKAKERPIFISLRPNSINNNFFPEVFCVQEYYNWKENNSYRQIEQFIFIRYQDTKQTFSEDGNIILSNQQNIKFSEKEYLGVKFLKQKEILELENNLNKINNSGGFIALIPVNKVSNDFIDKFNETINFIGTKSNEYQLCVSTFSSDEKNQKLSYSEVSKILFRNEKINYSKWDILNSKEAGQINLTSTFPEYLKESKTFTFLSLNPNDTSSLDFLVQSSLKYETNFDANKLFDLYFRVSIFDNKIKKTKRFWKNSPKNYPNLTDNETLSGQTIQSLLNQYFPNFDNKIINQKIGNFLLVQPHINSLRQTFSNVFLIDFSQTKDLKNLPKEADIIESDIIVQNIQEIFKIKLNQINENIFNDKYLPRFPHIFKSSQDVSGQKIARKNLIFIKNAFAEKIYNILQKEEYKQFIDSFYSFNTEPDLSVLKIGNIKKKNGVVDFTSVNTNSPIIVKFNGKDKTIYEKPLRIYQNLDDYINYYVRTVEALVAGVQDNV